MKNSFLLLSRLRSVLFALVLMLGCSFAFAQTKTISGTVTADGLPLPGVEVKVKGGSGGAVTDFDGLYKIDANVGDVLVFSSLGFETQSVTVASDAKIDIVLVTDVKVLEETVVIGYGTTSRKELVGSVVSVKAEDIEKVATINFEQALVAKAPGVRVVTSQGGPGAGLKIQVRGSTSFLASADPLYVIDGFPIDTGAGNNNQDIGAGGLGSDNVSPLANIDPANIESIEVLKDASATAIYGSRGANGVVLITTKSGKNTKAQISFESSVGVSRITRQLDLLNPGEFADVATEFNRLVQGGVGRFNRPFALLYVDDLGNPLPVGGEGGLKTFDFRDILFRDAVFNRHRLSVSGSSDKTRYSGAFSYTDQDGTIRNSNFRRYALNFNMNSKISDKLSLSLVYNGGYTTRNGVVTASSGQSAGNSSLRSGVTTRITRASPIQPEPSRLRDEEGNPIAEVDEDGFITSIRNVALVNPISQVEKSDRPSTQISSYFNTALEYTIIPGLTAKATFGGSFWLNNSRSVFSREFGFGSFNGANGRLFESNSLNSSFLNENTLNYRFNLGDKNTFNALAGFTQQRGSAKSTRFQVLNIFDDFVQDNARLGTPEEINSSASTNGLLSYLSRLNYNYDSRYYLELVGRWDGSNRFNEDNRWGFFPSIGAKWTVSNETFMENVDFINDINIKGSFGITGNQRIRPFASQPREGIRDSETRGSITQLNNPDLTWETTEQIDLGLNFGLFNNRIRFQGDVYQKTTSDLLYALAVPASRGLVTNIAGRDVPAVITNAGSIRNRGLELALGANILDKGDFKWSIDANITFNENEILDLAGNPEIILTSRGSNNVVQDYILEKGGSLGSYYGYQTDGLYRYEDFVEFDQFRNADGSYDELAAARLYRAGGSVGDFSEQEQRATLGDSEFSGFTLKPGVAKLGDQLHRPGQRKYKDLNGDGIVDPENDRGIIGSFQPDHFGAITNSFSYKGFDLSVVMNWSYGNEVLNHNRSVGVLPSSFANGFDLLLDRWTPFNRNTNQPSLRGIFPLAPGSGQAAQADSFIVEDGSYLRMSNISLSYKLPKSLTEKLLLKDLKIFGAVDNAYVWTNYSGYDPDVSIGNDAATPGLDFDSYPRARSFRLGLRGNF